MSLGNLLLAFCAGILAILLLVLVRGRVLENRWRAERMAAYQRSQLKFLNKGERKRRRQELEKQERRAKGKRR